MLQAPLFCLRPRITDPFNLQRFVDAQRGAYEGALAELHAGAKRGHWMWFVFPQARGLGRSAMAELYGITGLEEARAYLAHPVLGPRLRESVAAVLGHAGQRTAEQMLGPVDATKLRSCLTLFEAAGGGEPFPQALSLLFAGERDPATLVLVA
ncbi:DUF1810 domain-containing protein [Sphingomonas arenae]|uniref:DUF1810 domain-containing protein n=1 Tax=Sphingomonas arenae TaxID=2812555 RepID=UPI001F3D27B5|nr:DUF1810 domain-containing protein [Sphingomonas arenae]